VQLLNRNTKHVSLTESGRLLLENADTLAQSLLNLKELVQGPVLTASGRIRIGAPPSFGTVHLVPAIQDFLARYPAIKVSLLIDDGRSDLIAENIDLSVRIAPRLKDSNQIAYKITVVPQVVVATGAYLARHGRPETPQDLERHNCLAHNLKAPTGAMELHRRAGQYPHRAGGRVVQFEPGRSHPEYDQARRRHFHAPALHGRTGPGRRRAGRAAARLRAAGAGYPRHRADQTQSA